MESIRNWADTLLQNRYVLAIKKEFTITLPLILLESVTSRKW